MNDSYSFPPDRSNYGENFEIELITYDGVRTMMVWNLLNGRHEIYCRANSCRKIYIQQIANKMLKKNFLTFYITTIKIIFKKEDFYE